MKNLILITVLAFLSTTAFANTYSMRRCSLLPITDDLNGSIGFGVFEKVEEYLKNSHWCAYQSNSSLIDIFKKYNRNLDNYLKDPQVLRTVAEKLQVGSLIRVGLTHEVDQVKLNLKVYGENGTDIFLQKEEIIREREVDLAYQTVKIWLDEYSNFIPYDGKVLGVLGDQITMDIGKGYDIEIGQEFTVKRLIDKQKHKLLKTVVAWETDTIASGRITNISQNQAFGILKVYSKQLRIEPGDWILLGSKSEETVKEVPDFKDDSYSYGQLGFVDVFMSLASGTASSDTATGNKQAGGILYGFGVSGEAWITREYFVTGEFSKQLGNFSEKSGDLDQSSVSVSNTRLKIAGGYKYLPLGFFYGPQVNVYAGFARYTYGLEKSAVDGMGEHTIGGVMLGVSGDIPLESRIRLFAKGEIIPFSSFEDSDDVYSSVDSVSSLFFEIGGSYLYNRDISLKASLEIVNNSAKFNNEPSEINNTQTAVKLGGSFTF